MRGDQWPRLRAGTRSTAELSLNPLDSGPFMPAYVGRPRGPSRCSDFPDPARLPATTPRASRSAISSRPRPDAAISSPPAGRRAEPGSSARGRATLLRPDGPTWAPTCRTASSSATASSSPPEGAWSTTPASARASCRGRPWPGALAAATDARRSGPARGRHQGAELLRVVRGLLLRAGQPDLVPSAAGPSTPASSSGSWAAGSGWRPRSTITSTCDQIAYQWWTSRPSRARS